MWFPGLTFRVMFVLSHLIRTKEFARGETTVGHVAGEVVRALYGAGYMESTMITPEILRKLVEGLR